MSRSTIQRFISALAIALLAGCAASKYGAHVSKIKNQLVSTDTPAGAEWVRLACDNDPQGIDQYLEARGVPDHVRVHDYYRVDLFYLDRNEMVRCESGLGIVATRCLPEGKIPTDVRRQLGAEPRTGTSRTPAPPEGRAESPAPTAVADPAKPPAPVSAAPNDLFLFRKVPLGGALRQSLTECTSEGIAPQAHDYPCFLRSRADSAMIYFDDKLNPILRRRMLALLINGNIRALRTTFDMDDRRELAELLRAKYGPPNPARDTRPQDLPDAEHAATHMTWNPAGRVTIQLSAPSETGAKTGDLVVTSEIGAEAVEDATKREWQRILDDL